MKELDGLYFPAGQLSHFVHIDKHEVPSTFAEKVPASHGVQLVTAPPLERVPAPQLSHPVELAYSPAIQTSHPDAETTPLHEEQLDDPSGAFLPDSHGVQAELPSPAA
jgi:hypothetical protein